MRKILNIVLVTTISVGLFAGCGGSKESEKKKTISLHGYEIPEVCSYKVPETWEVMDESFNENGSEYKYSTGDTNAVFTIKNTVLEDPNDGDILAEQANGVYDWEFDSVEENDKIEVKIGKQKRKIAVYQYTKDEQSGNVYRVGVNYDKGYLRFSLVTTDEKKYDDVFKQIAESIVVFNEFVEVKVEQSLDYILLKENMRWNMALEEVKDIETRELNTQYSFEDREPAYLNYIADKKTDKYNDYVECVYCFSEKKLKAYLCKFNMSVFWDYKTVYNEIKNKLVETYGECESEDIVWTDTTYQNDEEKWNDAFRYGYVTIQTKWHTEDTAIILNWNYAEGSSVAISSIDFENQL